MARETEIITDKRTGNKKQKTLIMDDIPESENDVYVKTNPQVGLDKLANQYYNDPKLWWIIARANSLDSMIVKDGQTIRIPINPNVSYIKE